MAGLTLLNSNYNGEVLANLYKILGVGNEAVQKGVLNVQTGISTKKSLPRLTITENPIGDYVEGSPSSETATVSYAERSLDPNKATVYIEFNPTDFHDVWDLFKSALLLISSICILVASSICPNWLAVVLSIVARSCSNFLASFSLFLL